MKFGKSSEQKKKNLNYAIKKTYLYDYKILLLFSSIKLRYENFINIGRLVIFRLSRSIIDLPSDIDKRNMH